MKIEEGIRGIAAEHRADYLLYMQRLREMIAALDDVKARDGLRACFIAVEPPKEEPKPWYIPSEEPDRLELLSNAVQAGGRPIGIIGFKEDASGVNGHVAPFTPTSKSYQWLKNLAKQLLVTADIGEIEYERNFL